MGKSFKENIVDILWLLFAIFGIILIGFLVIEFTPIGDYQAPVQMTQKEFEKLPLNEQEEIYYEELKREIEVKDEQGCGSAGYGDPRCD